MPPTLIHLASLLLLSVHAQASPDPFLKGWEAMELNRHEIADTNVYVEPGLESLLPEVEEHLRAAQRSRQLFFQDPYRTTAILESINQILGVEEPNQLGQKEFFDLFSRLLQIPINPLYIVSQTNAKDLLRSGKSLPGFTYNSQTDQAICQNQCESTTKHPLSAWPLTLPVKADTNDSSISDGLETLQQFTKNPGVIIHEVTEMSLVQIIHPTDPLCRWFHDGVAEAVAYEVLKQHQGYNAAQAYLKLRDPNHYEVPKEQVNLRYWPSADHTLLDRYTYLELLNDQSLARYYYATEEVRRLIERHDLSILAKIIDAFSQRESRGANDLFIVIQELTGEDLAQRFLRYQTFTDKQEGIKHYATAYNEASSHKDHIAMLLNLHSLYELKLTRPNPGQILISRERAATLLFKLGYRDHAEKTMQRCIEYFSKRWGEKGRRAAEERYMQFALGNKCPQQAVDIADRHIEAYPGHTTKIARIIKMTAAMREHNIPEAQHWAKTVVASLPDPNNPIHRQAQLVLAMEPNEPSEFDWLNTLEQ